MATAASELFVKVSADVASLTSGFSQAAGAAEGLGDSAEATAAALRRIGEGDAALKQARLLAEALGNEFDETAEATKHAERTLRDLVKSGIGPGNAAFEQARAKLIALRQAEEGVGKGADSFARAKAMAEALGRAFDGTEDEIKAAEQAVRDLVRRGLQPGNQAFDDAVKRLHALRDAHHQAAASAQQQGGQFASLKGIIGGVAVGTLLADGLRETASAMASLGSRSLQLAGELEQNKVAFNVLLGSAEKAGTFLRDLQGFAANTPFELRGLTEASKRLLAFGFNAESIIPMLTAVGNASMGNAEKIDRITTALGQMAAKGKVSAEEMNQLQEAGIKGWEMVGTAIGKSAAEAAKMAEKGQIDAATAVTALLNGMQGKFGGMMEAQSKTFNGVMSNLRDSADQALTAIGDSFIKNLRLVPLIQTIAAAVNNLTAAFTSGGLIAALDMAFGPTTKAAVLGLATSITAALLPAAAEAGVTLTAAFTGAVAAAAPFLALGAAVAFAAYPIIKNWQEIKIGLQDVFDAGAYYVTGFYNRAVSVINSFVRNWQTGFNYIGQVIRSVLGDAIADKLIGGLRSAGSAFRGFGEMAMTPLRAIGSVASAAASNFAETWGDAMTASTGFTNGLFSNAAASSAQFSKKITAELLGLKKAGATTDDLAKAAKKLEAEQHKAEAAARKHAAALERLHAAGAKAYERFEAMALSLSTVSGSLAKVEAEAARLGRGFDLAGAKAGAIKEGLSAVEAAFGRFSPQANALREQMNELRAASENGGKAFADAARIVDEAARDLGIAREQARVLGEEFNELDVALGLAEQAMKKLIAEGVKPTNEAYKEQLAALRELQAQKKALPKSMEDYGKAVNDFFGVLGSVTSESFKLAELLGLKVPDGFKKTVAAMVDAGKGVGSLIVSTYQLSVAWTTLTAAIATNPIGAALTVAAVLVAGAVAAVSWAMDSAKERAEAYSEAVKKAETAALDLADAQVAVQANLASSNLELRIQQAELAATAEASAASFKTIKEAATSGLRDSMMAFMAGAQNYGEILRQRLREGIFQAVVDAIISKSMAAKYDQLIGQIVDAFDKGNAAGAEVLLKQLEDGLIKTAEGAGKVFEKLMTTMGALPDQVKNWAAGQVSEASSLTKKLTDEGSRGAQASYANNLLASVQRMINAGYDKLPSSDPNRQQYERVLAEANKARRDLRGMATGGLVTGPTIARMGEGGRNEAVLPLNENVYRQIGEGIAAARGGGSGVQLVVSYQGSGKWTREDAQGLGRLLVSELRAMGVRA